MLHSNPDRRRTVGCKHGHDEQRKRPMISRRKRFFLLVVARENSTTKRMELDRTGGCLLLAHRVISLPSSNSGAF